MHPTKIFSHQVKVSDGGKITILHNLRILNGLKDLKTIFRLKKTPRKNIISFKSYNAKEIFCISIT